MIELQEGWGSGNSLPERPQTGPSVPGGDETPGTEPSPDPGAAPGDTATPSEPAQPAATPSEPAQPSATPGEPAQPSATPGEPAQPAATPGEPAQPGEPAMPGWAPLPPWTGQPTASTGAPQPGPHGSWTIPLASQPPGGAYGQPPGGAYGQPPGGAYGQPPGGGYSQPPAGGSGQPAGGPPAPRRVGRLPGALLYLVVAVLAAAIGASMVWFVQRGNNGGTAASQIPTSSNNAPNANASSVNVNYVARKVSPSVVDITSYLGYTGQVFEGTGMVLSSSGLVLTNNHVVNKSTRLVVTLASSGRKYTAQVVGTDAADDVALLQLTGASGLKPVTAGDSNRVTLGTAVVALGNAGGRGGPPTVTSGSITAVDRTIMASDAGSNSSETLHHMMQTNAPIAEGDSGGPLANAAGQVIGMDTAANTQNLGGYGTAQGFAIPINRALAIARQMAAGHGSATIHIGQPAFMGIAIASTPSNAASSASTPQQQLQQLQRVAQSFGGGIDSSHGCLAGSVGNPVPATIAPTSTGTLIAGVFCNAPARAAGMGGGDVIVSVAGHAVTAPSSLTALMSHYRPGNTVSVTWVDTSGARHSATLTLAAGPAK